MGLVPFVLCRVLGRLESNEWGCARALAKGSLLLSVLPIIHQVKYLANAGGKKDAQIAVNAWSFGNQGVFRNDVWILLAAHAC